MNAMSGLGQTRYCWDHVKNDWYVERRWSPPCCISILWSRVGCCCWALESWIIKQETLCAASKMLSQKMKNLLCIWGNTYYMRRKEGVLWYKYQTNPIFEPRINFKILKDWLLSLWLLRVSRTLEYAIIRLKSRLGSQYEPPFLGEHQFKHSDYWGSQEHWSMRQLNCSASWTCNCSPCTHPNGNCAPLLWYLDWVLDPWGYQGHQHSGGWIVKIAGSIYVSKGFSDKVWKKIMSLKSKFI